MKTIRLIPLLILAVVLIVAPVAMADHCTKCKTTQTGQQKCWFAVTGGYPFCDDTSGSCVFSGTWCTGPHPLIDTDDDPFGLEFTVASVERLDEPQTAPSEPRVASLDTTPAIQP